MLQDGDKEVFDLLTARFEKAVLQAAQRISIGRNTITRKLQELGIDDWLCKDSYVECEFFKSSPSTGASLVARSRGI